MSEKHIGWQNESCGTFNELMKVVSSLSERDSNTLRGMVKTREIKTPTDLLFIPSGDYLRMKNAGKLFFLNVKKALYKNGFPYDLDTPLEIDKKIEDGKQRGDAYHRLRFEILKRDNFTCQYCGRSPRSHKTIILEIDHVHPQSKGGEYSMENLITSCGECNGGKSDILLVKNLENKS